MPTAFSPDGSKVLFISKATNLVSGSDTNGGVGSLDSDDTFIVNVDGSELKRLSSVAGDAGNGTAWPVGPMPFSPSGDKVLLVSWASNLVSGSDSNGTWDSFVVDAEGGGLLRASSVGGNAANGGSWPSSFSPAGDRVLFTSIASNLGDGSDSNGADDIFLIDSDGSALVTLSSVGGMAANGASSLPTFSPNGREVLFWSKATDLSTVDSDAPGTWDLFLKAITAEPSLSFDQVNVSKNEGTGDATPFTFTVSRSGDTTLASSVTWAVTGSGANPANPDDFDGGVLPGGVLEFPVGDSSSQTITVLVAADGTVEPDEGFTVTLSSPTDATLGTSSASGTIQNDDDPPDLPTVSISALSANKSEGSGGGATAFTFTVTRSGDTSGASSVSWSVSGSGENPADAADFEGGELPSNVVEFTAGDDTPKTITVNVAGDTASEFNEDFTVTLFGANGATIDVGSALGKIQNDDDTPALTYAVDALSTVTEDAGEIMFNVVRSGGLLPSETVYASTLQGVSAGYSSNGGDYVGLLNTSIKFAAGQTSQTVTVAVVEDAEIEVDETFGFIVQRTPTDPISTFLAKHDWTILDNDTVSMPRLSIAPVDAIKPEGDAGTSAFTFTITRSGDTSVASSVAWAVTGSGVNPADGADFDGGALPSGIVEFPAGSDANQTITVNVAGDIVAELDEGFTVTLFSARGAAIDVGSAKGTIQDNDGTVTLPSLSIAALDASKPEGNGDSTAFTFNVTRSGEASGTSSVSYSVVGSGLRPAVAADFVGGAFPSGIVSFAAGELDQQITLLVAGDTNVETHETFEVVLSSPSPGFKIGSGTATGTIEADDTITDLAVFDTGSSKSITPETSFYGGPVAGLEKELILITPANINVTASGPNWFIRSGSGMDALAAHSGRNVLDGGTNSNFLAGAGGEDTFFLDHRDASETSWSTVLGFGKGDSATVWGVSDKDFTISWLNDLGAEGAKGLTMLANAEGKATAALTLAGYSTDDMTNGRLTVAFGAIDPATPYLYVFGAS
jgi:hypothetical protein